MLLSRWREGASEFKNGFMKEVAFEQRIGDGAYFQHVEVREKARGGGRNHECMWETASR